MKRIDGWRKALDEYITTTDRAVFEWGKLDCAIFAANAVEAMTGVDLYEDFRGTYSTERGAFQAIRDAGFDNYIDLLEDRLGASVASSELTLGDLAVVEAPGMVACLGIVAGSHIAVMTIRGRGWASLTKATHGFKVGDEAA